MTWINFEKAITGFVNVSKLNNCVGDRRKAKIVHFWLGLTISSQKIRTCTKIISLSELQCRKSDWCAKNIIAKEHAASASLAIVRRYITLRCHPKRQTKAREREMDGGGWCAVAATRQTDRYALPRCMILFCSWRNSLFELSLLWFRQIRFGRHVRNIDEQIPPLFSQIRFKWAGTHEK